ncbi:MAG: PTS sugar transporter subunit IIA [Halieaceae bacterium]|nr:PTS sugar transporter subunit IIA [Halieaceae bacterium]
MLDLTTILTPERTLCRAPVVSKKRLFQTAAALLSDQQAALREDAVFASLLEREKLGSTALGNGVAIPHFRSDRCPSTLGGLITLGRPVDFEAPDQLGVDIVFILVAPEQHHQEHLDILAGLAKLLSRNDFCHQLRQTTDHHQLYRTATEFRL